MIPKDAYQFEQELIKENFKDPLCLNKHFHNTKDGLSKFCITGSKFTFEHKEKLSKAKLGVALSKEHKINIGKGGTGKVLSTETKLKLSEINRGLNNPRHKSKLSSEDLKELSDRAKGKVHSTEHRKKISDAVSKSKTGVPNLRCRIFSEEEEFKIYLVSLGGMKKTVIHEIYKDRCGYSGIKSVLNRCNLKYNKKQELI